MNTAKKPEPWASVARPNSARAHASARNGSSPAPGSGTWPMNHSIALPPSTPTAEPTPIWNRNCPPTWAKAAPDRPPAESRPAISAIPTGSFAPDSRSSRVPLGPAISRCPSTENTTAGSVGATAVAASRAGYQSRPTTTCRNSAAPAAVRNVPTTPTTATTATTPTTAIAAGHRQQRRRGNAKPLGDPIGEQCEDSHRRRQAEQPRKGVSVGHGAPQPDHC